MRVAILVFPGSNCDRDMRVAVETITGRRPALVWHKDSQMDPVDLIILPGGFSFGDYLRCGALAARAPVVEAMLDHASRGGAVLGICNGFQVLTEVGLLPGALIRNRDLHFICDRIPVRVENNQLPWTKKYTPQQVITLPVAHGEGRYYGDEETIKGLEDNQQIIFRYCNLSGEISEDTNPNGSLSNIAGISNKQGNVLGMMPHPERASDPLTRATEGRILFEGLLVS